MDLSVKGKNFIVTGASSGFGRSVAMALLAEGARVVVNARNIENFKEMESLFPGQVEIVAGDITQSDTVSALAKKVGQLKPDGMFINAGGPVATSASESDISQWDNAYNLVLRWKVELVLKTLPVFLEKQYGRLVFLESMSIVKPVQNLVLSNSFRMGVAGFVKTLATETASKGITLNIIAPGFHETAAVQRIITKNAEKSGISENEAKAAIEKQIPAGRMGNPDDIAPLVLWLLSPYSGFVTGQYFTADGGASLI